MFGIASTALRALGIQQMMVYGLFVFGLKTVPYQLLQRKTTWRHPSNSRVGVAPGYQYVGRGDDIITLTGVLFPSITGGQQSLNRLRAMADQGGAWPLIDGTGDMYGLYILKEITEDKSVFFADGAARKIEFQLSLENVDDSDAGVGDAGTLVDQVGGIWL